MATRGLKTQTVQAKVRQPKLYTSLQMEKTKQKNREDYQGQPESVVRLTQTGKTEGPQEQKSHEEILSVHIDDTQKSTYTA